MVTLFPLALEFDPTWFPCDGPVFGIPHGFNVLTNVPFLFVGVWGLLLLRRAGPLSDPSRRDALGLWISTVLLCFGSGLYHLYLTTFTLALDRICIAGITGFFAALSLTRTRGWTYDVRRTLLLVLGAQGTVVVWLLGGTSIPYGVVQAVGGVAVLLLFLQARRRGRVERADVVAVGAFLGLYGVAKLFEVLDAPICELTGVFGGHPIKHLIAAAGLMALGSLTSRDYLPGRESTFRAYPPAMPRALLVLIALALGAGCGAEGVRSRSRSVRPVDT